MTTEVIYARVPQGLKERVEEYGAERAMTTTTAVVDLLHHGLEAVSNGPSIARLTERASELEADANRSRMELQECHGKVQALQERERGLLAAYQGLTRRTDQRVGACPSCGEQITGYDLLVTGHCSNAACGTPVSTLLVSHSGKTGLDQKEVLLLLGAIGLLVGMAYLQSK